MCMHLYFFVFLLLTTLSFIVITQNKKNLHFGEEIWDMLIMVLQALMETVEYKSAFPSLNINSLHPI